MLFRIDFKNISSRNCPGSNCKGLLRGLQPTAPGSVDLTNVNYAKIKVQAINESDKQITVDLRGWNINVSPAAFVVGKKTNKEIEVKIEGKQYGKNSLLLEPKAQGCDHKTTSVTVNVSEELSKYFGEGIVISDLEENINIWDAKRIGLVVKNNTGETKKLKVLLSGLPSSWLVISNEVEIPTFQTKLVEIIVQPEKVKQTLKGDVILNYDSQDHFGKTLNFNLSPEFGNKILEVVNDFDPPAVRWALETALDWYSQPTLWRRLVLNGMRQDFSWDAPGCRIRASLRTHHDPVRPAGDILLFLFQENRRMSPICVSYFSAFEKLTRPL